MLHTNEKDQKFFVIEYIFYALINLKSKTSNANAKFFIQNIGRERREKYKLK